MEKVVRQKSREVAVVQGGYSYIGLWPIYMVFSGSIMYLTPRIGSILSFIIVCPVVCIIAKLVLTPNSLSSKFKRPAVSVPHRFLFS